MSPSTLRPKTQLILAIVLPCVCLLVATALIWPAMHNLRKAKEQIEQTQGTIQQKRLVISQADAAAQGRSLALAVAKQTEDEPITFLKQFAELTNESGATLVSVRTTVRPANVGAGQASAAGAPPASTSTPPVTSAPAVGEGQRPVVPPAVVELTDEATVEGRFSDIVSLIIRLENYERILSVSQCRIQSAGSTYPRLQAVFLLSRFVAAPEPPPAAPGTTPTSTATPAAGGS